MAKTQEIDVKIKAVLEAGPSIAGLKDLKKLLKETAAGSDEFKKISANIRDTEDSLQNARIGADDLKGSLEGAPGPLGKLFQGLKKVEIATMSFGTALKATGIGLVVAAIGGLVAAFSQNEAAVKKLEPLFIGLQKILGGIFRAMEPLLDVFIELAMEALPFITKGIGMFYSGLFSLFTLVKNVGVSVGKILKGIVTLDFDSLKEGAAGIKDAFTSVGKTFEDTYNRFEEGTKEQTKTEKENAAERAKILEAEAEKRKKVVDEITAYVAKGVESRGKTQQEELNDAKKVFDNLLVQAKKYGIDTASITTAYNEQVAKINKTFSDKENEEAQKAFDLKLKKQLDGDKLILDQLRANLEQSKVIYGENTIEVRKAQDDIFKAQEQGLRNEQALLEGKKQLTDAERLRLEQIKLDQQNLTTSIVAENQKRIKSDKDVATKKIDDARKVLDDEKKISDERFNAELQSAGMNLELQNEILQQKLVADEEYFNQLEILYKGNKEKLDEIDRTRLANQVAISQQEEQIRQKQVALQLQATDAVINALGAETAAGRAALIAKQFILAKELVLEIKRTIAFSKSALIQSKVSLAAGAAKTAAVGFPQNIPLLILFAAQAVSIIKTVIDATKMSKDIGADTGGGGGQIPSGTQVPRPRGLAAGGMISGAGGPKSDLIPAMLSNGESVINAQSTSMFRPLLSSINAIGGGRRFAEGGLSVAGFSQDQSLQQLQTMMNTQQVPIKTYVVASDMSNQQMLDRNIKDRSTL